MSRDFMTVGAARTSEIAIGGNCLPPAAGCLPKQRGFTLLEMVMVMTIIVILAVIGVTSYKQVQLRARETLLKEDLNTMRKLLDQYEADRQKLPQAIDDLVSAGYMREVPTDPITGEKDWTTEMGESVLSLESAQGIVDIHSNAQGQGSDGKAYSEY